jgi:hypothetical protein
MSDCSVNILARDAEREIGNCLNSIIRAGCFSEIVIAVDTRTKDRTVQAIEPYRNLIPINAFWYDHNGRWDELGARNATLDESRCAYIFWIDADELAEMNICYLLAEAYRTRKAYKMNQISKVPGDKYIEVPQIRLFPNIPGVKWELPIHCQVYFLLRQLGVEIDDTEYKIIHTGYDSEEKITDKHIRNFVALADYLNNHREKGEKQAYIMDRYNDSLGYLKEHGIII